MIWVPGEQQRWAQSRGAAWRHRFPERNGGDRGQRLEIEMEVEVELGVIAGGEGLKNGGGAGIGELGRERYVAVVCD
ncbi:hypothetical protein M0R45_032566 [Rubus argutus]|uniref:Uncharacterized protein n=1 Tax=Rubus argutus TaxID=59490 RepID=A0AAW1WJR9_RUBAR